MTAIAILGAPGSGKTTLAARLALLTALPWHDLDDLYWLPRWQRPDPDTWTRIQLRLTEDRRWLISGNYQPTAWIRISRADVVVVLDPPPLLCVWRLIRRTLRIYLGDTQLLPRALRTERRTAHRGLPHIIRTTLRYRNSALPSTLALADRYGVPAVVLRHAASPRTVLRAIDRTLGRPAAAPPDPEPRSAGGTR